METPGGLAAGRENPILNIQVGEKP